jgi:hypothetical protein
MQGREGPLERERSIARIAERQHGVIAHRQLRELGLGDGAIEYRVLAGRLHRAFVGVYAVGHTRLTLRGRWMAAVLACGPDALLSHRDAGMLWNVRRDSRMAIDVTAPGRSRNLRPGITVHRPRRALEPDERTVVDGIPVTSLARTLLDLAAVVPLNSLRYAWDDAGRLDAFDLAEVELVRSRFKRRRGLKKLDLLIAERRPLPPITRSELEVMFVEFCRRYGLPIPSMNSWIGAYEVDAAFHDQRVAVELDSSYHDTPGAHERDPIRDADLQIAGYRILRITYRRLATQPDELATTIRGLLAA